MPPMGFSWRGAEAKSRCPVSAPLRWMGSDSRPRERISSSAACRFSGVSIGHTSSPMRTLITPIVSSTALLPPCLWHTASPATVGYPHTAHLPGCAYEARAPRAPHPQGRPSSTRCPQSAHAYDSIGFCRRGGATLSDGRAVARRCCISRRRRERASTSEQPVVRASSRAIASSWSSCVGFSLRGRDG